VFWVISVYFNIRNTLPKSGPFLLLHPVYIYIYSNTGYWIGLAKGRDKGQAFVKAMNLPSSTKCGEFLD
jgi:hypothetical protein